MEGYIDTQSNAKVHDGPVVLDENIYQPDPKFYQVAGMVPATGINSSASMSRLMAARLPTCSRGKDIRRHQGVGNDPRGIRVDAAHLQNSPRLHAPAAGLGDLHFLLFSFHELHKGLPSTDRLAYAVTQLHITSAKAAPCLEDKRKRFGFHITTYNGVLAQDNTWTETWDEFYSRGMKRMLQLEEEARGPSEELETISRPFLEKVIPRLLRPLEVEGRSIEPVLIHGDLWIGNVSTRKDTREPMMFDASAFWGHNEYELGTMRPLGNDWGRECMASYHRRIPKSEPREDWDARNALYATRTYIHDSALYPKDPGFRQRLIDEMRKLVDQFGSDDAEMSE